MTPNDDNARDDTQAQYRFLVINLCRIGGAIMLVTGLAVIARQAFGLPIAAGYVLFLIGMFGGFYIVPLYAQIQTRSEPTHRSRIIAANNILNALFMVVAAGVAVLMLWRGPTVPQLLLLTGIWDRAGIGAGGRVK